MSRQSMRNIGIRNILWSLVCALFAAGICSAQTVLYFPQFVDGAQPASDVGWMTVIAVTNPAFYGTNTASGTITLTNPDGTPMNIMLTDENGNPGNTFQLAGAQTKFFFSPAGDGPQPFKMGYATLRSNLPVSAGSVFMELDVQKGTVIATAGVPASTPLTREAIIAVGDKHDSVKTGLAMANPGTAPATITFVLLDKSGSLIVPSVTLTLPPGNYRASFISELFPNAPTDYFGTLRVLSDKGIVTAALLFQGAAFGTVPVIPLPPLP